MGMERQKYPLRQKDDERSKEEDTIFEWIKLDFHSLEDPIVFVSPTGSSD
jgi:hypothetical protein